MTVTCIMCPLGCRMAAEKTPDGFEITGEGCRRGRVYAQQELTSPQRVVTSLARLAGGGVLCCKTDGVVPKNAIFGILNAIKQLEVVPPVHIGDILIENVLNTGINIIATKDIQ